MGAARPVPTITPELKPFFEAALRRQLVVPRCCGCGTYRFPPREICSTCLGSDSEWVEVSGEGEVFSFNVMHQVYHPGFAAEVPYAVVSIRLKEGPRMVSNLVGVPASEVRIGMPVRVVFEEVAAGVVLPKFEARNPQA